MSIWILNACDRSTRYWKARRAVLGQESLEHCRQHHRARIVCNALMAAEPGHPFFCSVTEQLPAYAANPDPVQPVLTTTGPFMLSDVYERFAGKNTITLMPPDYFYPLSMQQADKARAAGLPVELPQAYAVHYHVGSWWRPDKAKNGGSPESVCEDSAVAAGVNRCRPVSDDRPPVDHSGSLCCEGPLDLKLSL